MTANPFISAALERADRVFSSTTAVPHNNEYFVGYLPEHLPLLKTKRDYYKNHVVNKKHKQYVNYALRVAMKQLIEIDSLSTGGQLFMATLVLSDYFVNRLLVCDKSAVSGSKTPMAMLSRAIRERLCSPCGIKHMFFVVERGKQGNVHVHIVAFLPDTNGCSLSDFKSKASALGQVSNRPNSIKIQTTYHATLYRKVIGDENADLIELEVEQLGKDSYWETRKWTTSTKGVMQCVEFRSTAELPLDCGIADYLAKDLNKRVFGSSRYNFHISASLRKQCENAFADHLKELKSAM